jgi:hypothetical protein
MTRLRTTRPIKEAGAGGPEEDEVLELDGEAPFSAEKQGQADQQNGETILQAENEGQFGVGIPQPEVGEQSEQVRAQEAQEGEARGEENAVEGEGLGGPGRFGREIVHGGNSCQGGGRTRATECYDLMAERWLSRR